MISPMLEAVTPAQRRSVLDRFFRLRERGTTLRREVFAGFTTFATMSYVLAAHPGILAVTGMSLPALVTVTALAAAMFSAVMALTTNYPIAMAPGMGINAFFAYQVCLALKIPWPQALGLVFYSGVLFFVLSVSGVRKAIIAGFPADMRRAITAGIGLFIAFIGIKSCGLVVGAAAPVLVTIGNTHAATIWLTLAGLVLAAALMARRVPGALIVTILTLTVAGFFLRNPDGTTVTPWPHALVGLPASPAPLFLKLDLGYFWTHWQLTLPIVLALLFSDLFGSMAAFLALGQRAGLIDAAGNMPRLNRALMADSLAASGGALLGTSTTIIYIESASGIEEGGRTGLAALVVSGCFLLALFVSPLIAIIPAAATAPALIIIGVFMLGEFAAIDFRDLPTAVPAVVTVLLMLLTTIGDGMGLGLIVYVVTAIAVGRRRTLNLTSILLCAVFALRYVAR
jgi:AGZA family xanthine/uracil permease-like MFS transporter